MYCPQCEIQAEENAKYCANCGTVLIPDTPNIPNYLILAILTTTCCCPPTGFMSIVYAAQVNGKVAAGDFAAARKASQEAEAWMLASVSIGIALAVAYGLTGFLQNT